jgi:hypothetical protein
VSSARLAASVQLRSSVFVSVCLYFCVYVSVYVRVSSRLHVIVSVLTGFYWIINALYVIHWCLYTAKNVLHLQNLLPGCDNCDICKIELGYLI